MFQTPQTMRSPALRQRMRYQADPAVMLKKVGEKHMAGLIDAMKPAHDRRANQSPSETHRPNFELHHFEFLICDIYDERRAQQFRYQTTSCKAVHLATSNPTYQGSQNAWITGSKKAQLLGPCVPLSRSSRPKMQQWHLVVFMKYQP